MDSSHRIIAKHTNMATREVTYRLGENMHRQPLKLTRRMQYGTYGPWEWVLERGEGSYQDKVITIGGMTDSNMRDLVSALNDYFGEKRI